MLLIYVETHRYRLEIWKVVNAAEKDKKVVKRPIIQSDLEDREALGLRY